MKNRRRNPKLLSNRRGVSMIECAVVISLLLAIGTLSIQTLASLMDLSRRNNESLSETDLLHRLQSQFRRDAHLAERVTLAENQDPSSQLTMNLTPDLEIRYESSEAGITRFQTGSSPRKEFYALSSQKTTFSSEGEVVSMLIAPVAADMKPHHGSNAGTVTPIKIVAKVGRDRRYSRPVTDIGGEQK